ncbi:MAG: MBL fold metallo-hydrolase [Bdellovibrionota bacterium]
MNITFLGATQTVTGSKYLIENNRSKILVDCGLFQGLKDLRLRNRAPFSIHPSEITAVVLTHAHLDHSGYIPVLIKNGFRGNIYCTPGTERLAQILLPDAGYIQEEEAEYANRKGYSKHHPALPLFTKEDAIKSLDFFRTIPFEKKFEPARGFQAQLIHAGHIIGSSFVKLTSQVKTITFSGDLGRPRDPVMYPPHAIRETDYLVIESTYGNRVHPPEDPSLQLSEIINRVSARGGSIVIPAFAVGRSQSVLYHLYRLRRSNQIPAIPIYLDSPMSVQAMEILCNFVGEHRLKADICNSLKDMILVARTSEDSKKIDESTEPVIILSANGMATGGRVLHHIRRFGTDPKNAIVFTGFQALGTRGADLLNGKGEIKIHGELRPIRAEVALIDTLSAHSDAEETIAWLRQIRHPPQMTFITHGEKEAAAALQAKITDELGWRTQVPTFQQSFEL